MMCLQARAKGVLLNFDNHDGHIVLALRVLATVDHGIVYDCLIFPMIFQIIGNISVSEFKDMKMLKSSPIFRTSEKRFGEMVECRQKSMRTKTMSIEILN